MNFITNYTDNGGNLIQVGEIGFTYRISNAIWYNISTSKDEFIPIRYDHFEDIAIYVDSYYKKK